MAMRRCKQGHYYEAERYSTCPACGVEGLDISPTKPKSPSAAAAAAVPLPVTQSKGQPPPADNVEELRTVGVVKKQTGIDPVVGWLVCIEGADRGRDYRIRSERNLIGRAPSMDICISGDDAISRTAHAVISFEPRRQTFRLLPGEGHGLVYLDEVVVEGPTELKPYAKIELGQTTLLFIPLCGDQFRWPERQDG
jgi:hypothetical protein